MKNVKVENPAAIHMVGWESVEVLIGINGDWHFPCESGTFN
nr:hypothetical protein [Oceanobacillus halotolerans]